MPGRWYNSPMRTPHILMVALLLLVVEAKFAWADVPDDKTNRLLEYQAQHFKFVPQSSTSYVIQQGEGTMSAQVTDRTVIDQASDPTLSRQLAKAEQVHGWQQLAWGLGLPLGAYLFYDNFLGNPRPSGIAKNVPGPVLSFFPGNDWRSFALAGTGIWLATMGISNLSAWVSEHLGWSFANLLSPDQAQRAVKEANKRLREDLVLTSSDIASASEIMASRSSTSSATSSVPVGGAGSAAYYLPQAIATIQNQQGDGFKLYLVYTRDLSDNSGKLQQGSWRYLFVNPQKNAAYEVNVPIFGAAPSVGPAPAAFNPWKSFPNLADTWKSDSTKAMAALQSALINRGIPWLPENTTFVHYPSYGKFHVPVWIIDQGHGPMDVGYDAENGVVVDLLQAGMGVLPGSGGANPSGTAPGSIPN